MMVLSQKVMTVKGLNLDKLKNTANTSKRLTLLLNQAAKSSTSAMNLTPKRRTPLSSNGTLKPSGCTQSPPTKSITAKTLSMITTMVLSTFSRRKPICRSARLSKNILTTPCASPSLQKLIAALSFHWFLSRTTMATSTHSCCSE